MDLQQSIDAISDNLDKQTMGAFIGVNKMVKSFVEHLFMNGVPFPILLSAAKTRDRKHTPAQLCAHVVNTVLDDARNTNQVLSVICDLKSADLQFFKAMQTSFNMQARNLLNGFI